MEHVFTVEKLPLGTERSSIINGSHLFVSRLCCFKKQSKDINNKIHGGKLRSQLIYSLSHPFISQHDSPHCGEWRGAIKPIMLKWCSERNNIGNDAIFNKFREISFPILHILWNNILTDLSAPQVTESTRLAEMRPNIRSTHLIVLYRYDVLHVKPLTFMGNQQLLFYLFSHTRIWPFFFRF
jgi:hypothetical protein